MLLVAIVCGFFSGLVDDRPSFWRGFGEGLAGREKSRAAHTFFCMTAGQGLA